MKCDNCHQNEANIFYKETINDKSMEMHLCSECAEKRGLSKLQIPLSIASFLSGLAEEIALPEAVQDKKCPACGFRYSDFKERGRLGCSKCYESFSQQLMPMLRKIHGTTQHRGKSPAVISAKVGWQKEIAHLQEELKKAIKIEEYERAAQLRDQIKAIRQEQQSSSAEVQ